MLRATPSPQPCTSQTESHTVGDVHRKSRVSNKMPISAVEIWCKQKYRLEACFMHVYLHLNLYTSHTLIPSSVFYEFIIIIWAQSFFKFLLEIRLNLHQINSLVHEKKYAQAVRSRNFFLILFLSYFHLKIYECMIFHTVFHGIFFTKCKIYPLIIRDTSYEALQRFSFNHFSFELIRTLYSVSQIVWEKRKSPSANGKVTSIGYRIIY